MGLRIYIKHYIDLGDSWMGKEDFESDYADNLPALIELLQEDYGAVLDDAGGLETLVQSAEWRE